METTYTLRLPTDQYAYIEATVTGTLEEAITQYNDMKRCVNATGLSTKDFNAVLDEYVSTGAVKDGAEKWETMNDFQRAVVQEVKKCMARLNKVTE